VPLPRQTRHHGETGAGCQPIPPPPEAMPREFLLVDAHNLIFASPELASLHRKNAAAARDRLIHRLERHQDASGIRVVAVFDGASGTKTTADLSGPAGVQVFYPQAGQSADAIIERLVLKYAATHRLTVATNDNLIRTAANAAGASTMDSETLFSEMQRTESDLAGRIEQLRRKK
jgi:predicted RNA-binding protein with PIN domain